MSHHNIIWAKKDSLSNKHPLMFHILDVYHTAMELIESNLKIFSKFKSFQENEKKIWAAIIGLHDIGKATPNFQKGKSDPRHEKLSVFILFQYFKEKLNIDNQQLLNSSFFQTIKFLILHHSKFLTLDKNRLLKERHNPISDMGDNSWKEVQYDIIDKYLESIGISISDIQKISFKNISDAAYFSGLMTLADWVGSDINSFSLEGDKYSVEEYMPVSKKRAEQAIKSTGLATVPNVGTDTWADLFPQIKTPRNLQNASINCSLTDNSNLIIIEAPTGEGKSEAAFNLAARLSRDKNSGIYIAMPTQATSNGLYNRFTEFVSNADKTENTNIKLIHGGTFLKNLKDKIEQTNIYAPDIDTQTDAFNWFNQGKRAFLAPYGIGTVDQALYAILIVKHFFLRLYSLAGKTIIFDEVHAYDSYMNELLFHLIKWLKALNANVILLSATLPLETKKQLVNAWDENIQTDNNSVYPVLNIISNGESISYLFEARYTGTGNNNFLIDMCEYEDENVAQLAEQHFNNGARVLVIVNKVKRAQQIFDKIVTENKTLFHSRFTSGDRERIEKKVLQKYGKGAPATPSILVSTQIVEQSLDIDFDIIISDLAPIDLLIQRAGRLHRHTRTRPEGYTDPEFIIASCGSEEGELPKITDGKIYAPIILYRTYFALKQNAASWNFHRDFREPVEVVYYPVDEDSEILFQKNLSEDAQEEIRNSINLFNQDTLKAENEARKVFIKHPEKFDQILSYSDIPHEEEENGRGIIAKTRLGSDTEKLILLFEHDDKYYLDPDENDEFDISNTDISAETTYKLMSNLISLYSHLVGKFAENEPQWWKNIQKQNKMLNHYRLLIISGSANHNYDKTYGLTYEE